MKNVCIDPCNFKAVLRRCWVKYFASVVEGDCVKSVCIRSYSGPNAEKYGPE